MGFLDKLRGRAKTAVDQHGDKIAGGIDKAASMADKKTKGKYTDRINEGTGKTKEALDRLDDKNDGDLGPGARPTR